MSEKSSNIEYPPVKVTDVVRFTYEGCKAYWLSATLMVLGVIAAAVTDVIQPIYFKQFFDALTGSASRNIIATQLIHILGIVLVLRCIGWAGWRISSFANT